MDASNNLAIERTASWVITHKQLRHGLQSKPSGVGLRQCSDVEPDVPLALAGRCGRR